MHGQQNPKEARKGFNHLQLILRATWRWPTLKAEIWQSINKQTNKCWAAG